MTRIVRTFIFLAFGFICGSRFTIAEDDGVTHVGRKPIPAPEMIAKLPPDGGPDFNRLVFEKSPYLLQHAGNPVDWYPWGKKPLLPLKSKTSLSFSQSVIRPAIGVTLWSASLLRTWRLGNCSVSTLFA